MTVAQLKADDERVLRRWLMTHDPAFATHRQLKDYFLANTSSFGTLCTRKEDNAINAVCFFSVYGAKSFIHQLVGDASDLEQFREYMAVPCQAFLRTAPDSALWVNVLNVTPGFMVDHPAYDGVFSRVAPRFTGAVYEHP